MDKTKLILSALILWTLWIATIVMAFQPKLIDKLNEQVIIYWKEQNELSEVNKVLKVEREALNTKIEQNSNLWHNLEWKKQQIKETIIVIESWELEQ
jgi:uncharacterized coiled-coil protein SlyX